MAAKAPRVSISANFESILGAKHSPAQSRLRELFWACWPGLKDACEQAMKKSYRFHVCFATTKRIPDEKHKKEVKRSFIQIVKRHIPTLRFDPKVIAPYVIQSGGHYLPGRSPDNSPIVLLPKNREDFAKINRELADRLAELNRGWGTEYAFIDELVPENYTPHATLVNRVALNILEQQSPGIKGQLIDQMNRLLFRSKMSFVNHQYKL